MIAKGGRALYGQAIGILMFDGRRYPVLPGDVANASSYDFPVRLKVVKGLFDVPATPDRWIDGKPPVGAELLREAAMELRDEGVRAIVTACGFFVAVQDHLAAAAGVPVFTSPLIYVPLLSRMVGNRKIGILTASKSLLDSSFLGTAGITDAMNVVIEGIEESREFYATHMGGKRTDMDVELLRNEIVGIAKRFSDRHPDMAAMLLECSNLPTFSADIQQVTGLPVFDFITFIRFIHASVVQKPYDGFL
ncbi:MAG: aspartate/glutamate racemase family protein [Rhodoferax sp.]|nr:aspartate/glutamate racemase family protein [Rhodoferax sp.]